MKTRVANVYLLFDLQRLREERPRLLKLLLDEVLQPMMLNCMSTSRNVSDWLSDEECGKERRR